MRLGHTGLNRVEFHFYPQNTVNKTQNILINLNFARVTSYPYNFGHSTTFLEECATSLISEYLRQ